MVTASGLVGTVMAVQDDFVKLEIASNVEVRLQKTAVGAILQRGTLKALDNGQGS